MIKEIRKITHWGSLQMLPALQARFEHRTIGPTSRGLSLGMGPWLLSTATLKEMREWQEAVGRYSVKGLSTDCVYGSPGFGVLSGLPEPWQEKKMQD